MAKRRTTVGCHRSQQGWQEHRPVVSIMPIIPVFPNIPIVPITSFVLIIPIGPAFPIILIIPFVSLFSISPMGPTWVPSPGQWASVRVKYPQLGWRLFGRAREAALGE